VQTDLKFTDKDKEQLIGYMNFNAKHSKFKDLSHEEAIEFVGLLTYMQQRFLPKLGHCLEELKKIEEKPSAAEALVKAESKMEEEPPTEKKVRATRGRKK
jgi:hypothetical protein